MNALSLISLLYNFCSWRTWRSWRIHWPPLFKGGLGGLSISLDCPTRWGLMSAGGSGQKVQCLDRLCCLGLTDGLQLSDMGGRRTAGCGGPQRCWGGRVAGPGQRLLWRSLERIVSTGPTNWSVLSSSLQPSQAKRAAVYFSLVFKVQTDSFVI